jgi:HSP20 family protein
MANFFEKLKKGMGIEIPVEEKKEVKEKKVEKIREKEEKSLEEKEKWPEPEGELAVDMYQTESELVIQSPIAGIKTEDLNLYLEGGILFIEGERKKPTEEKGEYFLQECFWGKFSRKIVLPVEVNPEKISASFKDGVLTIRIPKLTKEKRKKILIKV